MINLLYINFDNFEFLTYLMSNISIFNIYDYIFYTIEIITLGAIIFVSKKHGAKEILDVTVKLVIIAAGSAVVYNNWFKPSGGNNDTSSKESKDIKSNNENKMINQIINILYINLDYRYSYLFPLILAKLDININGIEPSKQVFYGYFLLSLVALFCFLNIIFYILGYYILQKGNYEDKYPRFKPFINFYKKTNIILIIVESVLCLICLLQLVIFSLLFVYSGITNT